MKKNQKNILIFGILFILSIFLINSLNQKQSAKIYEVTLTEDGFSPPEVNLNKGDSVKFINTLNEPFWPASNLHPTHTIYPEFDPKKPIDKEWFFTFEKVGEWKYHDHLSPIFKGKITVQDGKKVTEDSCFGSSEKLKCYEELIEATLKMEGLKKAFEVLAQTFENDPQFAQNCHDFTHKLGEKAYLLFSEKKDFELSDKSSYCGYGFYHGFMETLLQKTANMDEARAFCEYADLALNQTTQDAIGACFHGIGHGAVDGSDPRFWGDPQGMIKPALTLCELVSNDESPHPRYGKLYRCVSGVFNSLEILSSTNQYKLSINKNDPFWICRNQPINYQEACFTQFVVAVLNIDNDFAKTAGMIDTIDEDSSAIPALGALVVEFVKLGKTDYRQTLDFCHNLSGRFRIPCAAAFAEGFLKYGPPEKEYVEAIKFCNSGLLTETERVACFERVLSLLRIWYTASKSQLICLEVDQKYRFGDCQYN